MARPLARRQVLFASLAAAPGFAKAAPDWPRQPIRLVVPFTPGGSNDAIARPLADGLGRALGQPVIVENRPGAASSIGAAHVANAAPDGHTLLFASSSFATSSTIQRTPYDALVSFEPVARVCTAPMLVATKPGGQPSMRALVEFARAQPGQLQYGSAGVGGIGHFAMELFNQVAGLRMEAVPYSGIAAAQIDLAAGRLDFLITTLASVRGMVEAGTLPVIAGTGARRMAFAPSVPTVREATGIDYELDVWWGLLAPRGTPAAIRETLNATINKVVAAPGYEQFLAVEGATPAPASMAAFEQAFAADIVRWTEIARRIGIRAT